MESPDSSRASGRLRRWLLFPRTLLRRMTGVKQDVLFLWVPKCAGTSVYATLVKYGCIEKRWETPLEKFDNRGVSTFGHVDVLQLIEKGVVSREYFDRAFKFAFVRNPFDRLVSLYFYLKKSKNEDVPEEMPFAAFCRRVAGGEIPPVGLHNSLGLSQCNPMSRWLADGSGRLLPDFVGRHENIDEDFGKVCSRIGIDEEIPHKNRTEHKPYREYYDDASRAVVERFYREDLERFGYSY
jgi:hypothetical protein